MPAGTRADSMKAGGAVLSWLHAARRRAQPGLQRVRPSWPACRFNACAMRGRIRVREITPSSPFLFGYNKISFSIHILVVGVVRVCLCERERGDGSLGCLIGKQMNNVSLGWRRKGDCNKCCVYRRDRESNFSGMSHM